MHYFLTERMRGNIIKVVFSLIFFAFCSSCSKTDNIFDNQGTEDVIFDDESFASITVELTPDLVIKEHYVSQKEETLKVLKDGESVAIIKLGEPIVIAQAEEECDWGWFQFPVLYYVEAGSMMVQWQMKPDNYTVYGDNESNARLISKDNGITWISEDRDYYHKDNMHVELADGNILQFIYCDSKDTKQYEGMPMSVNANPVSDRWFYKESELPEELRGVYFECWNKQTGNTSVIHSNLYDPGLLRYSYVKDDLMPILFNGDVKKLEDGSLVAGIYPGYYQNLNGEVLDCAISFYMSTDQGYNWERIGKIPFQTSAGIDPDSYVIKDGEGFNEPTFEILGDGTFLCVMRTGFNTPMYKSLSNDKGRHWSVPEPFTSNGVNPNLLRLENNVLVLSSGRPGVQVRFNIDGDGTLWTEPIEMLPFMEEGGRYGNSPSRWPTCGYTSLLPANEHTFYVVWSDFTRENKNGVPRKAIMFRKIEVIKRTN